MTDATTVTRSGSSAVPRRRPTDWRKGAEIAFFVTPALVLIAMFIVWPITRAVQFSLYKWKGYGPLVDFVGLGNYVSVLRNDVFVQALTHNLVIVVASIAIQLPLGLAIALLLNRKMRFQGTLRMVIFVPYVLSEVIAGVVWLQLLQPRYGVIDAVLGLVGLSGPEQGFLGTPRYALATVIVVLTWKSSGWPSCSCSRGSRGSPRNWRRRPRSTGPPGGRSSATSRFRCSGRPCAPGPSSR